MRIASIVLALCLLLGSTLWAQSDRVSQHKMIIRDTFNPTKVGVDDMKYIGTDVITAEDTTLMQWVTRVVQSDLAFYYQFEWVPLDPFYLRTYEIKEMDLLGWKRLGAEYTVRLEAEFPGQNLRVYWRLFNTNSQVEYNSGTLEYNRRYWREMAHDVSNEVVRTLTGDEGIFRSKIAFIKKIDKAKELFIADYDGANERQLTNTGTINLSPCFTPDGREIFFTSYMSGDPQIFKVEVESGEITQITNFPGHSSAPAISPDGKKIACVLSQDGNPEIYVLDITGQIIKRLTRTRAIESAPCWSPNGRRICYSSDRGGAPQLYIMDQDGLDPHRLTLFGRYNDSPVWSIRGDRVTFVSRTPARRFDLASIDTSGSDYVILTEVGMNENPHFSPDGYHIVFSSDRLSEGDIYMMDLHGRTQRRITRGGNCTNPTWGP